jgi:hypothetical protein
VAARKGNPGGFIKDVPSYIKKKTRGGKQVVDEMLNIAFGRSKSDTPIYEVKERWQALKWLGDHMEGGAPTGEAGEKRIFVVDFSKVPDVED